MHSSEHCAVAVINAECKRTYLHCEPEKGDTKLLSVSTRNINQFFKILCNYNYNKNFYSAAYSTEWQRFSSKKLMLKYNINRIQSWPISDKAVDQSVVSPFSVSPCIAKPTG